MSDAIEAVLRGAGLTDKPGEFDSSIHSWRCEHPETYGPCDCFQELVRELAEVERAAAARAVQRVRNEIRGIPHWWNTEEQRGGFDIPPLGPNASSEEGAFMEVMRVLDECAAEIRASAALAPVTEEGDGE